MRSYEITCYDFSVYHNEVIIFSEDPLPLNQNCDMVRIFKDQHEIALQLYYDDGSFSVCYYPAFDFAYLDSVQLRLDFYLPIDPFVEHNNPINFLSLYLSNTPLLYQVQQYFKSDTMIDFNEWGF